MKWKLTGWEGITFLVPEEWELSSVGGNREKGNFSLDDGYTIRVEAEWEYPRSPFSLEKLIEKYRKEIKRKRKSIQCKIIKVKSNFFLERSGKVIYWRNQEEGYSLISYCKKCGRLLFLRIYFPERNNSKEIFLRFLNSLSEHGKKGREIWAVYKFTFSIPEEFRMVNCSLKSGDLTFTFQDKKGKEVTLTQMALGSIILKNKSLSHWTRERIGKKIIGESEREKEGHLYFHFRYKKKFFSRRWEKGLSWYCPISQRIFLLMGNAELALIEIECHEKSKETSN